MIVKAAGLGSPRNGMPDFAGYVYKGTGGDVPERNSGRPAHGRKKRPAIPERAVAALRALGGDASTVEIRLYMELDGGPAFYPGHLGQTLRRLATLNPPVVTAAGRDSEGRGRAARWQLAPGADGGEP